MFNKTLKFPLAILFLYEVPIVFIKDINIQWTDDNNKFFLKTLINNK